MEIFKFIEARDIVGVKNWINNPSYHKNVLSFERFTPLLEAIRCKFFEASEAFIENEIYVNICTENGAGPLYCAAVFNSTNMQI